MATILGDVQYTQVMGHLPTPGRRDETCQMAAKSVRKLGDFIGLLWDRWTWIRSVDLCIKHSKHGNFTGWWFQPTYPSEK